jgi:hypothetical protein
VVTISANNGEVQCVCFAHGELLHHCFWTDFVRAIRDILQASPGTVAALRQRGFEVKILGEKL